MEKPSTLNVYYLQLQILFKNTTSLISLDSAKTDKREKIDILNKELTEAWGSKHRFAFQGLDNLMHIDFAEVVMFLSQIAEETYRKK